MKNTLKKALESNNLPEIRESLIDIIRYKSDEPVSIDTVTEVIETTPGLFDKDNGKYYADSAAELTGEQLDKLTEDLKSNFSLEKYRLFTEAYAILAENPGYYDKKAASSGSTSPGKIFGFILMVLGCAAAIVGLCVPVKFLLGIGIGVFMIGTAVVYINIRR